MQNRKDLLQAHRLMTQRAGLALLQGEPDTAEQPLRRMNMATFAGVMIAALAVAIFWILGILTHSGAQGLPSAGSVVIDENGNSYVRCTQGGATRLCPVINNASARLAASVAAGSDAIDVRKVSLSSLATFPRGPVIGISGLPPLPAPASLVHGPWSVCVRTVGSLATGQQQVSTLVAGRPVGGQQVRNAGAILVQAQNQEWLVWNDQRLATAHAVAALLPGGAQGPVQVPLQWLNALPAGPALVPLVPPDFGSPATNSPAGPETVGHVYTVASGGVMLWYVQLRDGLAQITETEFDLLQTELQAQQTSLSLSNVVSHLSPTKEFSPADLPSALPRIVSYDPTTPLCVVHSRAGEGGHSGAITTGGAIPPGAQPVPAASSGTAQPNPPVDQVWLPPGAGALVSVIQGPGQPTAYVLVTGAGKYPLASPAVAGVLGYTMGVPCAGQCTAVPANIVNLIPAGPALDPKRAVQPVTGG
ncbi:MAG TPA: type VII secretion protein EccB [Streptosporangiaceae bacterium]|nr:type VII secretion protein EccB [Streptosporangiaceae bacterium]